MQTSLYDASQGRNGGGNINAILKSGTQDLPWRRLRVLPQHVLNANEYFLEGQRIAAPGHQAEYFRRKPGWSDRQRGEVWFLLRQLPGNTAAQRTFSGNVDQHVHPIRARGRSRAAGAAQFAADFGVASADPVAVSLMAFQSNQFGAPANGYLFPLPIMSQPARRRRQLVQFTVSKPGKFTDDQFTANWDHEFRDFQGHDSARFFLLQFGTGHSLRRRGIAGFARWPQPAVPT